MRIVYGENAMGFDTVQYCEVAGHRLAYRREGAGEAILLVHGITTYSFLWRNISPRLKENFDVITVDLLGCGDSDKTLDMTYSLKQHAVLLHEFMARLHIDKFHFIGHDVGGGIGQIYAVNYPEKLIDLTLVNTVAYDFWPVQPIVAMRTPIIRQMAMATLDIGAFMIIVRYGMYHKQKVTAELMEFFKYSMKTKESRRAFLHFAKCLDNNNLIEISENLRNLTLPVLIIRGDHDYYLSPFISVKLHQAIPGSQLVHIETGGHFIQEDEPEKLSETILTFCGRNHA
jgi:pimeloyl-ACP methyl ester carboxylesterase